MFIKLTEVNGKCHVVPQASIKYFTDAVIDTSDKKIKTLVFIDSGKHVKQLNTAETLTSLLKRVNATPKKTDKEDK